MNKLKLTVYASLLCLVCHSQEITKTNLPATITITVSTNVVSGDNASGCNLCYDEFGNWKGSIPSTWPSSKCQPYHPATERWTITNVVKQIMVQAYWRGMIIQYTESTTLSSVTNR